MKHFLKHIVLFGLFFFIAEKGFYFFIQNASKKEYDKRLELILEGQMNKDIIILGSSRGANNISAKQLETQTGFSTYNLSYRGSNVTFQEFILKSLLLHNKRPKKILLVIDNGYQFLNGPSLSFRFDRLSPLKKYRYINDYLILNNKKSVMSNFLYSLKVDREDFSLKPKKVNPVNIMTSHGSKLLKEKRIDTLTFLKRPKTYDINSEDSLKLKSFQAIQKLCVTNNIELYYVFTPGYLEFDTAFFNRFNTLKNKEDYTILYDTINRVYFDKNLFRDHTHMFSEGAKIFTSEISTFINQK